MFLDSGSSQMLRTGRRGEAETAEEQSLNAAQVQQRSGRDESTRPPPDYARANGLAGDTHDQDVDPQTLRQALPEEEAPNPDSPEQGVHRRAGANPKPWNVPELFLAGRPRPSARRWGRAREPDCPGLLCSNRLRQCLYYAGEGGGHLLITAVLCRLSFF